MASAGKQTPERAATLFITRWREAVITTFVSRRARTLSACAAVDEAIALAESYVRSGGVTKPAVDPSESGHGVAMLPDVAEEALHFLRNDKVMNARFARRKEALCELCEKLTKKETVTPALVAQVRAVFGSINRTYLREAFEVASHLIASEPGLQEAIEHLAGALVSELRYQGWSEHALHEAAKDADPTKPAAMVTDLAGRLLVSARDFACFVSVDHHGHTQVFPTTEGSFALQDSPPSAQAGGRPMRSGACVRVVVSATDHVAAAHLAYRRTLSTLGAATIFVTGSGINVASHVVGVEGDGGKITTLEIDDRLVEERRFARPDQVRDILIASWRSGRSDEPSPLHDAIRLRHRAIRAVDPESRLLLLWSGIERLTSGALGHVTALSAAKALVSPAVTLGKLRRDIGDLTAVMEHELGGDTKRWSSLKGLLGGYADSGGRERLDRRKVLEHLLAPEDELKKVLSLFYDDHPLLVRRWHALWRSFGQGGIDGRGKKIASYYKESEQRVRWQVQRLYRSRNRVAHVGHGSDQVRELVWHAHFYLTQMIAICVHYATEKVQPPPPQEILLQRAGQYDALLQLLRADAPSVLTVPALLRPTSVIAT